MLRIIVVLSAWVFSPALFACAVCGTGQDASSGVFMRSTILLSAMPLLMLAGVVGYLKNQAYKQKHHGHEE